MPELHFCAGQFCPGLHWPASNTPHPTSCAHEHLNSAAKMLIYRESGYQINPARFCDSDEDALADMKRLAEVEARDSSI